MKWCTFYISYPVYSIYLCILYYTHSHDIYTYTVYLLMQYVPALYHTHSYTHTLYTYTQATLSLTTCPKSAAHSPAPSLSCGTCEWQGSSQTLWVICIMTSTMSAWSYTEVGLLVLCIYAYVLYMLWLCLLFFTSGYMCICGSNLCSCNICIYMHCYSLTIFPHICTYTYTYTHAPIHIYAQISSRTTSVSPRPEP